MAYLPAESDTGMFGGNSNWRGPIWMPVNALLIRALLQFYRYYGDAFKVECPTGSGRLMNLFEVAHEIATTPHADLPARRARAAAGIRGHGDVSERSRTGATTSCSTSSSTATTAQASARATRPAGRGSSLRSSNSSAASTARGFSRWGREQPSQRPRLADS